MVDAIAPVTRIDIRQFAQRDGRAQRVAEEERADGLGFLAADRIENY